MLSSCRKPSCTERTTSFGANALVNQGLDHGLLGRPVVNVLKAGVSSRPAAPRSMAFAALVALAVAACGSASLGCRGKTVREREAQLRAKAEGTASGGPQLLPGLRVYDLPGAQDGSSPSLAVIGEGLALAWISQAGTPSLKLATLPFAEQTAQWSEPQVILSNSRLLVNWADVAAIGETAAGRMVVAWPEYHSDDRGFGYGLRVAAQREDGSFSPAWSPDDLRRGPESGFVRFIATPAGLRMVWLDGRELGGGGHQADQHDQPGTMQLRSVLLDDDGNQVGPSELLDDRTCECCKLDVGLIGEQAFVAYRDRSEAEIRDIYVAGPELPPTRVAEDNWKIAGCPVNGPAVASDGAQAYVAWFSGAGDRSAAWLARGSSAAIFHAPIRFDLGLPGGRVDLLATPDGGALVSWFEFKADAPGRARLLARRVYPVDAKDTKLGEAYEIAEVGAARDWGFPRTALVGDEVLWVFTDPTPASGRPRLRAKLGPLPGN